MIATNRLRALAVVCLILGLVQIIYAGIASTKVDEDFIYGCWWGGLFIVLTAGATGLYATTKCRMITALIMSLVTTVIGFTAATLDGVAYAFLDDLGTCTNQEGEVFGDESHAFYSNRCQYSNPKYDCACVRSNFDSACYGFYLGESGGDCDVVLEETPSLLLVTFVVCLFASFFMLLFSCVTCGSVCCPTKCCGPADEGDAPWTDLEGDTQGEMTHVGVKANSIPLPEKNIV